MCSQPCNSGMNLTIAYNNNIYVNNICIYIDIYIIAYGTTIYHNNSGQNNSMEQMGMYIYHIYDM